MTKPPSRSTVLRPGNADPRTPFLLLSRIWATKPKNNHCCTEIHQTVTDLWKEARNVNRLGFLSHVPRPRSPAPARSGCLGRRAELHEGRTPIAHHAICTQ